MAQQRALLRTTGECTVHIPKLHTDDPQMGIGKETVLGTYWEHGYCAVLRVRGALAWSCDHLHRHQAPARACAMVARSIVLGRYGNAR